MVADGVTPGRRRFLRPGARFWGNEGLAMAREIGTPIRIPDEFNSLQGFDRAENR